MSLFEKTVSVIQGRAKFVYIPTAFAKEMKLKKGQKIHMTYDPDSDSLTLRK